MADFSAVDRAKDETTSEDELSDHAAAATAIRRLAHALYGRHLSAELATRITDEATELASLVEASPPRPRPLIDPSTGPRLTTSREAPKHERTLYRESVVSGDLNAMGIDVDLWEEPGKVVKAEVILGRAFEGAPGRSHGGIVASIFDEVLGAIPPVHGFPAYTGQLDVTYRAGTPVGELLVCTAWLESQEGRKLRVRGELVAGDLLLAEASALFITVELDRFAQRA
jgi:hypothetical protein